MGPFRILNLFSKFNSFSELASSSKISLTNIPGINAQLSDKIIKAFDNFGKIENVFLNEIEELNSLNVKLITFFDEEYPPLLKNIYFPPLFLYVKGKIEEKTIAVVGTRNPTSYGKIQAEKIAGSLAENNITVVSGMARGIDSIAHNSAINSGGKTIAVIGSGIDVVYPPENRKLYERICDNGAVITEFEPGTKPDAQNFPRRNRIISGLSFGTIVIESKENGGAMQTAALALDQNREVFAIPGNLGVRQSEGTNLLIQRGEAKLCTGIHDVLNELQYKIGSSKVKSKQDFKLSIFEEKIYSTIEQKEKHIDKISEEAGISISECLVHLLSMELRGIVKQLPGKMFAAL